MVVQNNHLMKVLNDLAAAYASVAGEKTNFEDFAISLALLERALAQALRVRPELLAFVTSDDIAELDTEVKAHVGRVLAVHATLLYQLQRLDEAVHSARLAVMAFRQTLAIAFDDEDRYVASYLHQLLKRDVATHCFRPDQVGEHYEALFSYYADAGLFDRAEDMLFHAIELRDDPAPILARGLAFYDELVAEDTRILQQKGLPRHEVNQARAEILQRLRDANA